MEKLEWALRITWQRGGGGRGEATATSGGLQLDVPVGRLNLVMSASAVAAATAAGEQMSNRALHYTAWLPTQILILWFQIFRKACEYNGCAGAFTKLHQVHSLNVMEWILILRRMTLNCTMFKRSVPTLQKTNPNSRMGIFATDWSECSILGTLPGGGGVPKFFPQGTAAGAVNLITRLHLMPIRLDAQCLINPPAL
jgi:hypothetical protein